MGDFEHTTEKENKSSDWIEPTLAPVPEGFQLVEIEKLKQFFELAKSIKGQNEEYFHDVHSVVNAFIEIMDAFGLTEVIKDGRKPDAISLAMKIPKLIRKAMRGENQNIINAGKTLTEFLKKYGQDSESIKMLTDGNHSTDNE